MDNFTQQLLISIIACTTGPIALALVMYFFGLFTLQTKFEELHKDNQDYKREVNNRFDKLDTKLDNLSNALIVAFAVKEKP